MCACIKNPDITVVKNPGQENMQVIIKKGQEIKVMNMTEQVAGGQGRKLGTAYRLTTGEVIYVPKMRQDKIN